MKNLLEYLAKNLTNNDQIEVLFETEGETQIFTIKAPQEVMGLLIGKEGRTIRSIRSLARARAIIDKINVTVKLEEISS